MKKRPRPFFDRVQGTSVTRIPRRVVAIVPELLAADRPQTSQTVTLGTSLRRWSIVAAKWRDGSGWLRSEHEGVDADNHWKTLFHLLQGRSSYWLIMPSVGEWLAATGGYKLLTAGHIWIPEHTLPSATLLKDGEVPSIGRPGYVVLNGPVEILNGRYLLVDIHCVSAGNYGVADWKEFVNTYRPCSDDSEIECTGPNRFAGHGLTVARCLSAWYTGLMDQWRAADGGIWGETAAKISYGFYQRRHATGTVTLHQNEEAHRLERAALFGGRAEVYKRGTQVGEFYRVDVRGMYPAILAEQAAPTGLSAYGGQVSVPHLVEAMRTHVVAATVRISTEIPRWPFRLVPPREPRSVQTEAGKKPDYNRREPRTLYPIGDFDTALCGEDLASAVAAGAVTFVYSHAIYRRSMEFAPMMRECLERRQAADALGRRDESGFWKLLANSFAGRWARRSGGWIAEPRISAAEPWAEWIEPHPESGRPTRCRSLGYIAQVFEPVSDKPSGCPIIFAWLTAAGRARLWAMLQAAGEENTLQVDTDGLWLNADGLSRLQAAPGLMGADPGQGRVVERARACHFVSPRHHQVDGTWTMAGFSDGFRILADGTLEDYSRRSLYETASRDGPDQVLIDRRISTLATVADHNRAPLPFGESVPWRLKPGDATLHHPSVQEPLDPDD